MPNPVWISHRGYHADCAENTIRSFDSAVALGFTHLETDLRCTADGHIVLQHDASLKRSFRIDKKVEDLRLAEIRALSTEDGQKVLTFDDFMQRYAGYSWTFDIKPESDIQTLHRLRSWAQKRKAESWLNDQARFLLWTRQSEYLAGKLFPAVTTLAQERECYRAGLAVFLKVGGLGGIRQGRTYSLPRWFMGCDLFQPKVVGAYHQRGARIIAYLPTQQADVEAALAAGFDEILTDGQPLVRTSP
jgi:glycerophosphoryl diester phosphodiesterase